MLRRRSSPKYSARSEDWQASSAGKACGESRGGGLAPVRRGGGAIGGQPAGGYWSSTPQQARQRAPAALLSCMHPPAGGRRPSTVCPGSAAGPAARRTGGAWAACRVRAPGCPCLGVGWGGVGWGGVGVARWLFAGGGVKTGAGPAAQPWAPPTGPPPNRQQPHRSTLHAHPPR